MSLLRHNTTSLSLIVSKNYKDVLPIFTIGNRNRKLLEPVVLVNISVHFLTLEIWRCLFRHFL